MTFTPDEREVIEGRVAHLIFYNEENGYAVISVAPNTLMLGHKGNLITVVGTTTPLHEGDEIQVIGEWVNNPRYGVQLKAEIIQRLLPVSREGILRYLSSDMIKGVGKKIAQYIVDEYGEDTLKMLDSPDAVEKLERVQLINHKKAKKIVESWTQHRQAADVMMFLQQYGIGQTLAYKVYKYYSEEVVSVIEAIKENPYCLVNDIRGIGFYKADEMARNMGLPDDSSFRLQAGIIHTIQSANQDGHLYLPISETLRRSSEILRYDDDDVLKEEIQKLCDMGNLIQDTVDDPFSVIPTPIKILYINWSYYNEVSAVRYTTQLYIDQDSSIEMFKDYADNDWDDIFDELQNADGLQLSTQQMQAVKTALLEKISILTGGPGTGKSTTTRAVIECLKAEGATYALAAPTGRAAKRIQQASGYEAQTIHRLLGYNPQEQFTHDKDYPLHINFLVLDECSMLDMQLYYAMIQALPHNCHLLMVGDVDQLPSVGAGDVLRDLIRSDEIPVTRLNTIFRQDEGSRIISNAHAINEGEMPDLSNQSDDFFFFRQDDPYEAANLLTDIVADRIPRKFGYDPLTDIQVLSPMYKGALGVKELNSQLQARLNPKGSKAEVMLAGTLFRVGDKVMQLRNNYDKEVFNGDIGHIISISPRDRELQVHYEDLGDFVIYDYSEAEQLMLAYACSVHRAQGSEYPVVVMPVSNQHYIMLQRNLLYTGVTRAKKIVTLVGTPQAVRIAVQNNSVTRRWTALDWRLHKAFRISRGEK